MQRQTSLYKQKLISITPEIMTVLLLLHPILDIISFWRGGSQLIPIRMTLLIAISAIGFFIARNKLPYLLLYSAICGFWILHIIGNIKLGYQDPLTDLIRYFNLIQFPLWTFSFITFFQEMRGLSIAVFDVLMVNFPIIIFFMILSLITQTALYTQKEPQIGFVGWASSPHTYSIILAFLTISVLLWALNTDNLIVFSLCVLITYRLLYAVGTKVAFYSAILIAIAFIIIIALQQLHHIYIVPLLLAILLLLIFRGNSPLFKIQNTAISNAITYQNQTDEKLGSLKDNISSNPKEISAQAKETIISLYEEIYGDKKILGNLIERFGKEKVAEAYRYTVNAHDLLDKNTRNAVYHKLLRSEHDFLTKLVGFEYADDSFNNQEYHMKKDWPELFHHYGYLGGIGYLLFLIYILWTAVKRILGEFPHNLSVQFLSSALMFILLLFISFVSFGVFANPSITIYMALSAASIYSHSAFTHSYSSQSSKYTRKSVVTIKRL